MTNINETTGIRFGYISAQRLHPDTVHELMYSVGTDLSYLEAVDEIRKRIEREADSIEEGCKEALLEIDYHITSDPGYERILDDRVEKAYVDRGYSDREEFIERRVERETECLDIEEPIIEGTYEGVRYQTSWLGGALNFWIFESPVVGLFDLCSPCVPNAGNLDSPNHSGYLAYDVPADWRVEVNHV